MWELFRAPLTGDFFAPLLLGAASLSLKAFLLTRARLSRQRLPHSLASRQSSMELEEELNARSKSRPLPASPAGDLDAQCRKAPAVPAMPGAARVPLPPRPYPRESEQRPVRGAPLYRVAHRYFACQLLCQWSPNTPLAKVAKRGARTKVTASLARCHHCHCIRCHGGTIVTVSGYLGTPVDACGYPRGHRRARSASVMGSRYVIYVTRFARARKPMSVRESRAIA